MTFEKMTCNGIETKYTIDTNANIYRNNKKLKIDGEGNTSPTIRCYINNSLIRLRLDRLMHENFLGGNYYDDIPVFHIDGNQFNCNLDNLHVGFLEDQNYPNEIWGKYEYPLKITGDPTGLQITHKMETNYWVSTYGRCYSNIELTGIVLDYATPRAYWDTPDPVEGTPPVCYSHDSIISYEGKACSRCPFNDFGSKDGESNAKACKESVMIFLLRPDNIMPIIIRVPVSSKLIFQRYMTRLIGKMLPLSGVVTKITLAKTTNKTGQPYSLYNFETVSKLSSEEATQARNFGQQFMKMFNDADLEPIVQEAS